MENEDPDGLLLVDKPAGITSHDVVYRVRRFFKFGKVGHGGTLDPAATGLLVLLIGKGTRISDRVMGGDKIYTGTFRLGRTTSTQDKEGETLEERPADHITPDQVEAAMNALTGDQYQIPPMVSAIKMNGVPLYKLARKGQEVERKERFIHVYRFRRTGGELPDVAFEVASSKGTYVRTLAHDAGQALGCGAHLTALRREASGSLTLADAIPLARLLELPRAEVAARVIPCTRYLSELAP